MNLSHPHTHEEPTRPARTPYDDMTLSQLITYELKRQRISYDTASERAYEHGCGISGSYLCILVRNPLNGLRPNTIDGVAAALGLTRDIVAGCAMRSWGCHVYPDVGGSHVVISTSVVGLTAEQALRVRQIALETEQRMEAITNDAGGRTADTGARAPLFSNGVSHQREQATNYHRGPQHAPNGSATNHHARTHRPKANS